MRSIVCQKCRHFRDPSKPCPVCAGTGPGLGLVCTVDSLPPRRRDPVKHTPECEARGYDGTCDPGCVLRASLPEDSAPLPPTGIKHDTGKRRWDLVPWDALGLFVDVLTLGAAKYSARNWEGGIAYGRLFGATQRHLTAWWQGEDADPESGHSHLAHALCDVAFLLAFVSRGRVDLDDRPARGKRDGGA